MSEPKVTEGDLGIAARIWCEPQHSRKTMDVDFANSIAKALSRERQRVLESQEVKDFEKASLKNHDKRCVQCDAKLSAYCDFIKAHRAFEKLKASTSIGEEGKGKE